MPENSKSFFKIFVRPLLFKLEPETGHQLAINFLKFLPRAATTFTVNCDYKNLRSNLWDIDFSSPIGLAAGFDKNAEAIATLANFGFGFLEVGTVTPKAQKGNERPRIFRLTEDEAIINRLGFNNLGSEVFAKNLEKKNFAKPVICPLGINIGKNKDTVDAISDYLFLLEKFYHKASYITLNISSPNTKNLRDLQNENQLDEFLFAVNEQRNRLKTLHQKNTPLLVKVAPDLDLQQQEQISRIVLKNKIDGLIISNTTIAREQNLLSEFKNQEGGLSGRPLFVRSNEVLKNFYRFTNGQIPLIGVGGVSCAADVYEKIKCGASLVQIYSAFIYQGFSLVEKIKKDLSELVQKDGFKNISEAVGRG